MFTRRTMLLGATFAGLPRRGIYAAPEIKVSLDLVEAIKLLIQTVHEMLGTSDEGRARRARAAVPQIAEELMRIAASKDQIGMLPGLPESQAAQRAVALATEIERSLGKISAACEDLDSSWKTKNIETLGILYNVVQARMMNAVTLRQYSTRIRATGQNVPAGDIQIDFFARQQAEAQELRRLASILASSVERRS